MIHIQGINVKRKTDLKAKTITSLIKTFNELNAIEKDCAERRLNSEFIKLQLKVKNKIECDILTYRHFLGIGVQFQQS